MTDDKMSGQMRQWLKLYGFSTDMSPSALKRYLKQSASAAREGITIRLADELNLPVDMINIERVGDWFTVVQIDFTGRNWKTCEAVYRASTDLLKRVMPAGIWFVVILDHEDWRREKRIAALKVRLG